MLGVPKCRPELNRTGLAVRLSTNLDMLGVTMKCRPSSTAIGQ